MKIIIYIMLLMLAMPAFAQRKYPDFPLCSTKISDSVYLPDASGFLRKRLQEKGSAVTSPLFQTPYVLKLYIRIFRDNDGTNQACTEATAIQNYKEMNGQYSGHNICFQLVDIDYINDSYANNMIYDSLLDTDYKNYLSPLAIPGAMTLFVHNNFVNSGSSGNAYGIPNNFLSVASWAINSANVHSIFAHEMGHCLGLYHTFETWNNKKVELVSRSQTGCNNCTTAGDLCCDTPADYWNSWSGGNMSGCSYVGTAKDACNNTYSPNTVNIMSYMPWGCISFNAGGFTTDQRTRMYATINDNTGPVYNNVVPDTYTVLSAGTTSTGFKLYSGRTALNFATLSSGVYNGSLNMYGLAYDNGAVIVMPGVTMAPGVGGKIILKTGSCDQ